MKGFLCITKASNDEEYRRILKQRNKIFIVIALIGIAVAVVATLAELKGWVDTSSRSIGFFAGIGAGLTGASIGFIIKNLITLKNEKKLKEARIANSDERTVEIARKAHSTTLTVLALALVGGLLVGGIFYPILIDVFSIAVFLWAVTYLISSFVYNRKM